MRMLKRNVWPYTCSIDYQDSYENIKVWCFQHFGKKSNLWFEYAANDKQFFSFKDTESLLLFKLTWGQYGIKTIHCKKIK